jgi:translocation and assembly module TamA
MAGVNATYGDRTMRPALAFLLFALALPAAALEVKIQVQGLEDKLEQNVRAFLSVEREKQREGLGAARLRLLHQEAGAEIRQALRPFGYFRPQVEEDWQEQDERITLTYRIDPGPRVPVAEVRVEVLGPDRDAPLFARPFPIAVGSELDQAAYDQAKQALLARALEQGYLQARYRRAELQVDLDAYVARIHLELDPGQRYRFGEVRYLQDVLDPAFLARYQAFRPGDPVTQEALLGLQSRLTDSEYFSQVELRVRTDQAEGDRVPLDVTLVANKPSRYRAGVGYSTDSGPRISADWTRRYIGRQGHRMTTELRLALPHSSFRSEYLIPLERPAKDSWSFSLGADHYDTDTRVGERYVVNTGWSVGLADDWRRTLAVDFAYEDAEVGDDVGTSHHLIPNATWSRLRSDGQEFMQRGSRLSFSVLGAAEPLISSSSFFQLHSNEKFIFGFGEWRLLGRVELGASWAEALQDVPASKRFFAGGDNSVRGFDLDAIGPTDAGGEVVGGRYLAVASAELERHLQGKWSAAVFLDAGNAFDPDYDNRLEYSAGVGVRWRSPVGPVRLDLASGLSRDSKPVRLHVVVGPEL